MKTDWSVLVGNVGHVYQGNNGYVAWITYRRAVSDSKCAHGRASGECVTLFRNGEIHAEYFGHLEQAT